MSFRTLVALDLNRQLNLSLGPGNEWTFTGCDKGGLRQRSFDEFLVARSSEYKQI